MKKFDLIEVGELSLRLNFNDLKKNKNKDKEALIEIQFTPLERIFSLLWRNIEDSDFTPIKVVSVNWSSMIFMETYANIILNGKWQDDNIYMCYNKDKKLVYKCDTINNRCDLMLVPGENTSIDTLIDYVKTVTSQDDDEISDILYSRFN